MALVTSIPHSSVEVLSDPEEICSSSVREMLLCSSFLTKIFTFLSGKQRVLSSESFSQCQPFLKWSSDNLLKPMTPPCASLFHLQHSSSAAWHIRQAWPPGTNFAPSWVFLFLNATPLTSPPTSSPPFLGANEKQMLHQRKGVGGGGTRARLTPRRHVSLMDWITYLLWSAKCRDLSCQCCALQEVGGELRNKTPSW